MTNYELLNRFNGFLLRLEAADSKPFYERGCQVNTSPYASVGRQPALKLVGGHQRPPKTLGTEELRRGPSSGQRMICAGSHCCRFVPQTLKQTALVIGNHGSI